MQGEKIRYYARNLLLVAPTGHRLLQVRAGGSNPHPFVECKGDASELVCGFLRGTYDHRPARIDVAEDRRGERLFFQLIRLTKRIAKKYGLKWAPWGDWVTPDAGRTIYLASRQSQVFVRVYEKGLKYAHDLGLPVTDELRQWIRIEVEFKPQNPKSKASAQTLTPDAIWGTSDWLIEFASEAFGMEAQKINIAQRRESDMQRALRFMGKQYGAHLSALFDQCDRDLAAFGAAVAHLAGLEDSPGFH